MRALEAEKMAKVRVRFFATFREISGCPESPEEASDISELLDRLSAKYGGPFGRLLGDREADSFVVLVNGNNMRQLRGVDTELRDGDEISLFPPISGG